MSACAPQACTSEMVFAKAQGARAARFGTARLVCASRATTGTGLCVCSVSTGNNGMKELDHASVRVGTIGTASFAKRVCNAQVEESTTRIINCACVPMATSGMEFLAWSSRVAAVGNSGMKRPSHVSALRGSNGTAGTVFSVQLASSGISRPSPVSAPLELSGTTSSAL